MLQFEFDIRDHKINNNESKGMQLTLGIAFLVTAALFFVFKNQLDFLPFNDILIFVLVVLAFYFIGLLLGFKILYPKEYLIINSRKLKYKTGWGKKELKLYLKDINDIRIENQKLLVKLKSKEELDIDLTNFSDQAISILRNYLNLTEQ